MPRGPLPDPNRRRTNAPTIPTTRLKASGPDVPPPEAPEWIDLGEAGMAWWEWAWHTPQACAWDDGQHVAVARRASIEDDLRVVNQVDSLDFLDALNLKPDEDTAFRRLIQRLAGLCIGRDKLIKRADDLDKELGLTPKGMAALRWVVVDDKPKEAAATGTVTDIADRRQRLLANGS